MARIVFYGWDNNNMEQGEVLVPQHNQSELTSRDAPFTAICRDIARCSKSHQLFLFVKHSTGYVLLKLIMR